MDANGSEAGPPAAGPGSKRTGLFREDALRHHLGRRDFGDVLRLPPHWTRLAFPLVLAFVATLIVYLCVGTVEQYARGPGIVRGEVGGPQRFSLVAFLPEESLPRLRPGMRLRVELVGRPGLSLWTTIDRLGESVVGPAEARRILGPSAEDSLKLEAPAVVAWASLERGTSTGGDDEPALRDGMRATVETAIATERLIFALLPGLASVAGG
jgi:hypothetical protein